MSARVYLNRRGPYGRETVGESEPDPDAKPVASVHRFHESVAVYVGSGETRYLTARQARDLAKALTVAARSIEREKFTNSNVGTVEIK